MAKDICIPIDIFLEKYILCNSLYRNGEFICVDYKHLGPENIKSIFEKDVFIAVPRHVISRYETNAIRLDFKFSKELETVRKQIGRDLEDELTKIIKPETKKELYEKVAEVLDCDEDYVKKVFKGKRSVRSETLVALEDLFGINIGSIFGKSTSGTLNRNTLKELQRVMSREEETGDEIRRYLNELRKSFNGINDDEVKNLCEELTDFLHSKMNNHST